MDEIFDHLVKIETERQSVLEQLAELTSVNCGSDRGLCGKVRDKGTRCCASWACEEAIKLAKNNHGIALRRTGHSRLPLMGPNGCTVPPHLREYCATYDCSVVLKGANSISDEFSSKYTALIAERNRLATLRRELMSNIMHQQPEGNPQPRES